MFNFFNYPDFCYKQICVKYLEVIHTSIIKPKIMSYFAIFVSNTSKHRYLLKGHCKKIDNNAKFEKLQYFNKFLKANLDYKRLN